ncbi:MAG TPA: DUF1361 domain-containing protein [Gaiellaceae bacterium]|nr:DUF1361 domain-containing protein [Gaiellaceae bacterium]
MKERILLPLAGLAGASVWCVGLVVMRTRVVGDGSGYLVWNLLLAWIPLALAAALAVAYARRRPPLELVALGLAWLLFLPNAPYVLTDFVHLHRPGVLWRLALTRLDAPLGNHELIAFAVAFGGFLLLTYTVLWGLGSALAGVLASNRPWRSR